MQWHEIHYLHPFIFRGRFKAHFRCNYSNLFMVRRICIIKRQRSRDIPARQAAASFRQVGQKIALVRAASSCAAATAAAATALISNHVVTRLRGHCAGASPCPWRYRHRVRFSRRCGRRRLSNCSWQKTFNRVNHHIDVKRSCKPTGWRWKVEDWKFVFST